MDSQEFHSSRQQLQKTQKQIAELLGISIKAVQSFEQGWRKVPVHIERQMLLLVTMKRGGRKDNRPCWEIRKCSSETRQACPAWEFDAGALCWFINGTLCQGKPQNNWGNKMKVCRRCKVFQYHLDTSEPRRIVK
jgi:DNA-binding XRE family transcriptional regulator